MIDAIKRLFNFEGVVAVVTGGGSGIGKATASLLAQAGATVVIVDRDQSAGESAASAIVAQGGSAFAATADITDETAVEKLFADTVKREGTLMSSSTTPALRSENLPSISPWRIGTVLLP